MTAKKLRERGVTHARIARYHAAFLDDLFLPGALSGLYINHPDPWPKERHEKNRLISRWFLHDVCRLLAVGGLLRLKSDHKPNIDRVSALLAHDAEGNPAPRLPLSITGQSDDVITGPAPWPDDIETNYQSKFRKRGEPVYAIEVRRTDEATPPIA
jgi:tRNA G46 methylase TrmB